jgi:hypothetical protein
MKLRARSKRLLRDDKGNEIRDRVWAEAQESLGDLSWKVNPRPHPFIEFWRYSHPSLARRIDFVLHYKPWEEVKPNRLWNR